ncbi:hypothetical protein MLD38_013258 [Melastoma candidum]|uniref:Uncharacterized protein n=1 Tax=Melastoma candidum TaxID=119954 RepID=A0ACB9RCM8_9MYRT|nr:hypothetical protein MLD38_013258 [Melastoma candidum]
MVPGSMQIRSFARSLRFLATTAEATNPRVLRTIFPVRIPSTQTLAPPGRVPRWRSLASGSADVEREIDLINVKFGEAREEIETAMESRETVYFDEEAECAREAVREVLERFEGVLGKLKEGEREALRRSMGLKMEQLKAELKQLDD